MEISCTLFFRRRCSPYTDTAPGTSFALLRTALSHSWPLNLMAFLLTFLLSFCLFRQLALKIAAKATVHIRSLAAIKDYLPGNPCIPGAPRKESAVLSIKILSLKIFLKAYSISSPAQCDFFTELGDRAMSCPF